MDVTAILSTSSALGIVDEAFGVSETLRIAVVAPSTMTAEQSLWQRTLDGEGGARLDHPDPDVAPQQQTTRVASSKLASMHGVELLDQLTLLNSTELSSFVSGHPASIAALLASPPAATSVATLWEQTSPAQHARLVSQAPQVVGSLEGFPYSVRDVANRAFLTIAENDIRGQLSDGVGRAAADQLHQRLHMLGQVRAALTEGTSTNQRSLVSLDPSGEGRAVIVVGDPSTADYVDYLIPGMFSDVDTQIVTLANGSDTIATEQQSWIKKLNPDVPESRLPTVATFAWIGYHTPNIVNVASMDLAREGQASLTSSLEGLRAERAARTTTAADGTVTAGAQPFVAVLAHSYGSTAAMLSLQDDAVSVDALAIVGSPGSPARSAHQLKVTNGNVWVGAAQTDPVPQTGIFGSQPLSAAYGAHHFGVDGATDPMSGVPLRGAVGHNDYFVTGTESLRNMVLIGINRGDLVIGEDGGAALALGKSRASVPSGPSL